MGPAKHSKKSSSSGNSGISFGPTPPPPSTRTVSVSADGGPPQAMTPEAAAKYLQQATTSSHNREVKISFGPSRPPPRNAALNNNNNSTKNPHAMSFGSLDLQALKETAAAAAASQQRSGGGSLEGMPCSEAEMKALMGMFVEIMGMSMDGTSNNNSSSSCNNNNNKKNGAFKSGKNSTTASTSSNNPMLMFGNHPLPTGAVAGNWPDQESLAAATAGFFADGASWDALRRTYGAVYQGAGGVDGGFGAAAFVDDDDDDDDDDEDDSIPDLDHVPDVRNKKNAPGDWESLEKVAGEDALEVEERTHKAAAKKREKKQRRKQKQREEAAQKVAEANQKKREKAILSWRGRVVSACQSAELSKLEALLQESPLDDYDDEDVDEAADRFTHLEFLWPNTIAKNRSQLERGKETRHLLAKYILALDLQLAFTPLRSGRTAIHTACFHGDVSFVQLVLEQLEKSLQIGQQQQRSRSNNTAKNTISREDLNITCSDSGWTPLHYAVVSGSIDVLELLLRAGCNVETMTDNTHTWRRSDGCGVTPRELIECIQADTYEQVLESHGVALQEVQNNFSGTQSDRQEFVRTLDTVVKRLKEVEVNGYVAPGLLERSNGDDSDHGGAEQDGHSESAAKKRKKKKKKKKQTTIETEPPQNEPLASASVPLSAAKEGPAEDFEDPLVTALLGMGFAKEQISAAVKACGGTNRATADDLVTWILGQDANGSAVDESNASSNDQADNDHGSIVVNEKTVVRRKVNDARREAEEENRQKVEAAKRLAEKREEQRRRNREWNNRAQARQHHQVKTTLVNPLAPAAAPMPTEAPPAYNAAFPALSATSTSLPTGQPDKKPAAVPLQTGLPAKTPLAVNPPAPVSKPAPKVGPKVKLLKKPTPTPIQTVTNPVPVKVGPVESTADDFSSFPLSATGATVQPPVMNRGAPPVSAVPPMTAQNSFPPIGDDERTVSSFGSNRGLSVSSAPYVPPGMAPPPAMPAAPSFAPPGFMQPALSGIGSHLMGLPMTKEEMEVEYGADYGQLGEIRATAKEFVPKGYTPPPMAPSRMPGSLSGTQPPLSNNFGPALLAPLSSSFPQVQPSFDNSATPFSQGFLGSSRAPPPTNPSFLGGGVSGYDRMPTVTPVSEDTTSTTLSIGSSLTGVIGLDDSTLSAGLGSLGFGMEQPPTIGNTTSLLTSSFTNAPPIGGESIWGESGPSLATSAPSGLPPLNFGGVSGTDTKERNGEPSGNDHLTSKWGVPGASNGGLNGGQGGSIW